MALTRYGELRNQLMRESFPSEFAPVVIREAGSNYVPIPISERLVQAVWYDQRLHADALRSVDEQPVRVIFPGWWNLESGPDFRHATLQIGNEPEQTGDVEVHLRAEDWIHHGHHRDPDYNNVILHVVLWEAGTRHAPTTENGRILPQLALQHQLTAPLESLYDEMELDTYPHNVGYRQAPCPSLFKKIEPQTIQDLLDTAGDERFAVKARKYARWIHRVGPQQAFYEAWMEALGYKANKQAFRLLAQRLPIVELERYRRNLAALFFGVANFLPTGLPDAYGKRLWGQWWKLRPDFDDRILPSETWRLHAIRPANHPHRRIGAAVALLKKHPDFLSKVIGAIESGGNPARFFEALRDEHWNHHFTLGGKRQRSPIELIGAGRAQEIIANVVLPFVAALSDGNSDASLYCKAKTSHDALPAAPTNSLIRLAGQQLFGSNGLCRLINSSRRQQGLIQVFLDFCVNDRSGCKKCQFPELARRWTASA